MKRIVLALFAGLLLLQSASSQLRAQAPPLTFFKNHILTGDYVVGGVGLRTSGQGQIAMSGVPSSANGVDVVAAYLYWQVVVGSNANPDVGATGVTFRGYPLSGVDGVFGKVLGTGSPTCSASGGATGGSNGSKVTYTYRADVLRYLDVDAPAPAGTGKTLVNGLHSVSVPKTNQLDPLGASLVVVYRDASKPLSAVVLYDGGFTMNQATERMSLALEGFYEAGTSGKLSYIAGSGQANKSERLVFNNAEVAVNPFTSALGAAWDNPTFPVTPPAGASSVTTIVDNTGFSSFDCLNFAAVVFRTTVQDSDDDGLIDAWERSTAASPVYDPLGQALPPLADMGANPLQKDLFIEVGYMKTDASTSYGGVGQLAHSHLPPPAALKLMGDTLKYKAPTGQAINVHFDVGDTYIDPTGEASDYVIRGTGLARGGEAIDEAVTVCTPGPNASPWDCQFSAYPGTVGWKSGFRFLRDEVVVAPPAGVDCDLPGASCERRFDRNRHQMFHYALFAHAVGLPVDERPCLDASGQPTEEDPVTDRCVTGIVNPQFRVPRTNTGVGDFPGGDILVTLGAFPDVSGLPVGTPFMQASTLLHELGHNAERRHGGDVFEPNCKPAYPSAMNYLYQLRGLLDNDGTPHLDFSAGQLGLAIDENRLTDGVTSSAPYRLGWYAPLDSSYLAGRVRPAARHCDGTPILPGEVASARIDARSAAGPIDWNANSTLETSDYALDVNFNGRPNPALGDSNDWAQLRLNQIGVRRNVGTLVPIPGTALFAVAPLSLDAGKGDLGKGDLGKGDLGKGDLGKGDLGKGDLGKGDLGKGDLGKGDLGKGDLGGGDLFVGDPKNPGGELDFVTAGDLAKTPPNQFRACVIGSDAGCTGTAAQFHRVRLDWTAPNVGGVASFTVYRVDGTDLSPGQTWVPVASVPAALGAVNYTTVDTTPLVNGAQYTYFAVATYADGVASDASNLRTIVGVNDPPKAVDDAYGTNEDTVLSVPAPGVLGNDTDDDSPGAAISQAVVASSPQHGTLVLNADGSFTYTPAPNYNGTDEFTYRASDGTTPTNAARVLITVSAVNDAPTATNDSFSVNEDTPLAIPAPGVLGNDSDLDGDSLNAVLVTSTANGTLALQPTGAFSYTPAPNFFGTDSFSYRATDGPAASGPATVTITVVAQNDAPSISDIGDVTVPVNGSTGALAFTVGDVDGLTGLTVSAVSSNPTLVPASGIVFGGSGAARTITVTLAAGVTGAATITVTVRDAAGLSASDTFVVTVRAYTFVGLQNIPPPTGKTFKAGSSIPLSWQYRDGGTVVDSSQVRFTVTAVGPLPNPTINNSDSGQSSFRYSSGSWNFNLQTKDALGRAYPVGTYQVTVTSNTPGFPSSPTFLVTLVK